ncbi:MAG: right-handed parallel beta-helix repeat-containing protein [Thermoplasmatota archaeon]
MMKRNIIIISIIFFIVYAFAGVLNIYIIIQNADDISNKEIWLIEEFLWKQDEDIHHNGSIYVDSYTTLYLENVDLHINPVKGKDPCIFVKGKMVLENCTITGKGYAIIVRGQLIANNTDISGMEVIERELDYFYPDVWDGLTFMGGNSRIGGSGLDPYSDDFIEMAKSSVLTNCTIHDNRGAGIRVTGSTFGSDEISQKGIPIDPIIRHTKIYNCDIGIAGQSNGFPLMDHSEIFRCDVGILVDNDDYDLRDTTIKDNVIRDNEIGIEFRGIRLNVAGNRLDNNGIGIFEYEFSRHYYFEIEVTENLFIDNDVAYQGGPEIIMNDSSFVGNRINLIIGEKSIIGNTTFDGGDIGIICEWSSPMIRNCSFEHVEKQIYIEGGGHPIVNRSDMDIEMVYWGYYNDWDDYDSSITIDGEKFFPVLKRSEYLGEWNEYDDYYDYW